MKNFLNIFSASTLLVVGLLLNTQFTAADSSLAVTITPPLFQLDIGPGETWASSLKIVNNNTRSVTYYAQVVDMEANGETGQSRFMPLVGKPDPGLANSQMASWIQLQETPVTIAAGKSADLHFTVYVPQAAEPGGHYAAILVGTTPITSPAAGAQMKISSFVSSLMLLRVRGDIVEKARIREFTTDKSLFQEPQANFLLRFENLGNTHLRPAGEVVIYNMWGKERGKVTFNHEANFGNVLPKTIRRFAFSWEGEENIFDIGRYSAVVTLSYGETEKQNISATTYFYYVPLVPVAITLGIILFMLLLLAVFIRMYIRRALTLERARRHVPVDVHAETAAMPTLEIMMEPLQEAVVDLRKLTRGTSQIPPSVHAGVQVPELREYDTNEISLTGFIRKYATFFAFMVIFLVCIIGLWIYLEKVLVPQRNFDIKNVLSQQESTSSSQ